MPPDVQRELDEAIARVLASKARKKLVVAGPGAGKSTVFRKLLDGSAGNADFRCYPGLVSLIKRDSKPAI